MRHDFISWLNCCLSRTLVLTLLFCLTAPSRGASFNFDAFCPTKVNGVNRSGRNILQEKPLSGRQLDLHRKYKTQSREKGVRLLFMGDSMVELFDQDVFRSYFDSFKSARFGISGDTVSQLIWRLKNNEMGDLKPDVLVLMIGTNNAGINTNVEIGQGITHIINIIHNKLPETKILLTNVFPAGKKPHTGWRRQLKCINKEVAGLEQRPYVSISDAGKHLLDDRGFFSKNLTSDFVHPNKNGYQRLAQALKPRVEALMRLKQQLAKKKRGLAAK